MPAERQAPMACRPIERFTCIVPRGRTRRAWSGARGPMPQAAAFDESPRHRQIPQVRAFVESNCIRRLQHDRPQPTAFDITAHVSLNDFRAMPGRSGASLARIIALIRSSRNKSAALVQQNRDSAARFCHMAWFGQIPTGVLFATTRMPFHKNGLRRHFSAAESQIRCTQGSARFKQC